MNKIFVLVLIFVVNLCGITIANEYSDTEKAKAKAVMMNEPELEIFLRNSKDLEMTDENGFTSLFSVALTRNSKILKMWIKAGANVNAVSKSGSTPLFFAVLDNQLDSIDILIESGVNVNHKKMNGDTVLHYAIQWAGIVRAETIIRLINHGADVNALNSEGNSPLFLLREGRDFRWGNPERSIESLLIQKNAKDISGYQVRNQSNNNKITSSIGTKSSSNFNQRSDEISQSNCSNTNQRSYQKKQGSMTKNGECNSQENYNPIK